MGEPATTAKVILHTDKGPLNIELWAKECPVNTKHFLKNCLNGNYISNNSCFNKISKNNLISFNTGKTSQENSLKKETNQRIRFTRRGLVGFGNALDKSHTNEEEFFITLRLFPEFNNNYTIFGTIADSSIYNAIRISDSELEEGREYQPIYPTKILKTEVIVPYFEDLDKITIANEDLGEPAKKKPKKNDSKKKKKKAVKLSYEDDHDDVDEPDFKPVKIRSAHVALKDHSLSKKKVSSKNSEEEQLENEDQSFNEHTESNVQSSINTEGKNDSDKQELEAEIEKLKKSLSNNKSVKEESKESDVTSFIQNQKDEYRKNQKFSTNRQLREIQTFNIFEKFEKKISNSKIGEQENLIKNRLPNFDEEDEAQDSDEEDDYLDFMDHQLDFKEEDSHHDDDLKTVNL